jgi:hypothetical protein
MGDDHNKMLGVRFGAPGSLVVDRRPVEPQPDPICPKCGGPANRIDSFFGSKCSPFGLPPTCLADDA